MFGLYRYLLIQMILLNHLTFNHDNFTTAVFAFFMLSGFLVTLVTNKKYKSTIKGYLNYLRNRVISIYPLFYFAFALTVLILFIYPENFATQVNQHLYLSDTFFGWASQLFLIGFINFDTVSRIVPTEWFLSVLLVFYLIIPWLSKTNKRTAIWVLISLYLSVIAITVQTGRRDSFLFVTLPISLGALIYWIRDTFKNISVSIKRFLLAVSLVLIIFLLLIDNNIHILVIWYVILIPHLIIITSLSVVNLRKIPPILIKIDSVMGKMSYTIFLTHWIVGSVIAWHFFGGEIPMNYQLYLYSFLVTNCIAYIIYIAIDKHIINLKNKKSLLLKVLRV